MEKLPGLFFLFSIIIISCREENSTTFYNNTAYGQPPTIPSNPIPRDSSTWIYYRNILLFCTSTDPDTGDTVRFDFWLTTVNPPNVKMLQMSIHREL